MLPDYQPIFLKYNNDLKPLVSEIEGRLERFSQPLLLNIASVYDYMSISAADGQDKYSCLAEADRYVDLCISQSYMCLIYAIKKNVDAFEKSLGKKGLRKLNSGHFIGRYTELKKNYSKYLWYEKTLAGCRSWPRGRWLRLKVGVLLAGRVAGAILFGA